MRFAAGLLLSALRFVPRMWFSETERLGLRSCTPLGYRILYAADLTSFLALLLLLSVPICLGYAFVHHRFAPTLWWLLLLPFGAAFAGSVLMNVAWSLARRNRFRYDYASDTARWVRDGLEVTYPDGRVPQSPGAARGP